MIRSSLILFSYNAAHQIRYICSLHPLYSSLIVKPTNAENRFLDRSTVFHKISKIFKISLFSYYTTIITDHSIIVNLVLDWLVVQLRLQFFAVSNFSNSFVEILVNDVLPLGSVNILVISEKKQIHKDQLCT